MANRAEKTNPLQASLRQARFFSANPARGIIRAHPRYPWLIPSQLLPASEFLGGASLDAFLDDPKTQAACMRQLEVIGEAVKRLSDETRNAYPNVPCRGWAGMCAPARCLVVVKIQPSSIRENL